MTLAAFGVPAAARPAFAHLGMRGQHLRRG